MQPTPAPSGPPGPGGSLPAQTTNLPDAQDFFNLAFNDWAGYDALRDRAMADYPLSPESFESTEFSESSTSSSDAQDNDLDGTNRKCRPVPHSTAYNNSPAGSTNESQAPDECNIVLDSADSFDDVSSFHASGFTDFAGARNYASATDDSNASQFIDPANLASTSTYTSQNYPTSSSNYNVQPGTAGLGNPTIYSDPAAFSSYLRNGQPSGPPGFALFSGKSSVSLCQHS